jgi:hypothetical protein
MLFSTYQAAAPARGSCFLIDISTRPPGTFGPTPPAFLHLTVILPDASVSKRVKQSLVVIVDIAAAFIWWKEKYLDRSW